MKKWYETTRRWCQTNLTEIDAKDGNIDFWEKYWEENHIQGIIVNAGGIVAYYPSQYSLQYRSKYLEDRDLVKLYTDRARKHGIRVLARMDINRASKAFYDEHPDWFAVDRNGVPYKAGERYLTCINGEYYRTYIPMVLREIIEKYHPDGFTDNSWQGPNAKQICYCKTCREKFLKDTGRELPKAPDWNDTAYKVWIRWSFQSRVDNWDLYNEVTKEFGGEDCLWMGMVNANPVAQQCELYDLREIGKRSHLIMTDHQSRDELNGFEQNALNGMLLHSATSWDMVIPESMANYVRGRQTFRKGSNPKRETVKWIQEGIAGGISPWVHYIGAVQYDRRMLQNCKEVLQWHLENEEYLYDRRPISNIGIVWSQENVKFYGQDRALDLCEKPWRGISKVLTRSRIPAIPVHADDIDRYAEELDLLVLPELAVMTDAQTDAVIRFIKNGGSIVFTGTTGTLDEWGDERPVSPLYELFGIRREGSDIADLSKAAQPKSWEEYHLHNYMRCEMPEHPVLKGFEEAGIIPFGGLISRTSSDTLDVVVSFIEPFPIYPPEISFTEQFEAEKPGVPMIYAGDTGFGGKVVYFAGDIDRRYCEYNMPDHGDLLSNAIHYCLQGKDLLKVEGPGYIDCRLYAQGDRVILHVINLTGANQYPGFLEEEYPVGPIKVSIRTEGKMMKQAVLRSAGESKEVVTENGWTGFTIDRLESQELIIIE